MGAVLGQMVMTSLSVVLPGLYFLLMVEPHPEKAYRYRFLLEGDVLQKLNNAVSVGLVGYSLFVLTIPFFNWLFDVTIGLTVRDAVMASGTGVQLAIFLMLAVINITMAYFGLQK